MLNGRKVIDIENQGYIKSHARTVPNITGDSDTAVAIASFGVVTCSKISHNLTGVVACILPGALFRQCP